VTAGGANRISATPPVKYEWVEPSRPLEKYWWLYGCPAAAALAIAGLIWYVLRLIGKQRFPRRAVVHVRKGRMETMRRLVRGRDWLGRWFWPSRRESRLVEHYLFIAYGGGGHAVLVSGETLGEGDEIAGWQFDPVRKSSKRPQNDARVRDNGIIRRRVRSGGGMNRIEIELQYARSGQRSAWPE